MFLRLFCTSRWLTDSIGAHDAMHDLQFFKDLFKYRSVYKEVADVVLGKLMKYRKYLTEEVLPFVLFSTKPLIDNDTKHNITAYYCTNSSLIPISDQFRLSKPVYWQIIQDTSFEYLVGPDSYTLCEASNRLTCEVSD